MYVSIFIHFMSILPFTPICRNGVNKGATISLLLPPPLADPHEESRDEVNEYIDVY